MTSERFKNTPSSLTVFESILAYWNMETSGKWKGLCQKNITFHVKKKKKKKPG